MDSGKAIFPGTRAAVIEHQISYTSGTQLGCHSLCVSNLGIVAPRLIEDPSKEMVGKVPGARIAAILVDGDAVNTYYKALKEDESFRSSLFTPFKDRFRGYSIVFMSCPCNTDSGVPAFTGHPHGPLSIAGFVEWLRKSGEFIIGSPLVTNVNHQTSSFSLLRGWMWIPSHSSAQVRHIEGTEYVSGKSHSMLPLEEWKAHYREYHRRNGLNMAPGGLKDFQPSDLVG